MDSDTHTTASLEAPDISFDDVVGLVEVKSALREIALFIKASIQRPDLTLGVQSSRSSILLYGPPGTGKTMLACAVARECGARFLHVDCEWLSNPCTSYSRLSKEDQVRAIFSTAVEKAPCMIFLEGIDAICDGEGDHLVGNWNRTRLQMLRELDEPRPGVIVVATTERIDSVEGIALRKFQHRIEVPLPDVMARRMIIAIQLESFERSGLLEFERKDRIINWLAEETEGLSGGAVKEICFSAYYEAIRRNLDALGKGRKITLDYGYFVPGLFSANRKE